MRVAIVGSGVAGLVAALLFSRQHRVTVFEARSYAGGHTATVRADLGAGPIAVDTGFIVFNHRTYPNFTRLLGQLGVASQPTSMSVSVRCDRTGMEWASRSPSALFAQRRNLARPSAWRMLADIARFNRSARDVLDAPDGELTVRRYLRHSGLSRAFVDHYLVPLGAAMWSCPPDRFLDFPMRFLVRFLANHGMLKVFDQPRWQVVRGGSATYVEALVRRLPNPVRLATPIARIRRFADHVAVVPERGAAEVFDHVIVACHSDQALALLDDPSPLEREILAAFPYQANDVVLHTDASVLPRRRAAWSSWNYRIPADHRDRVTLTYNMNILQGLRAPRIACVTVNDEREIDPAAIIRRFRYHHPIFTVDSPRYQAMHQRLIDHRRTSYCGAYWRFGFHEDGVRSALAVGRAFGLDLAP